MSDQHCSFTAVLCAGLLSSSSPLLLTSSSSSSPLTSYPLLLLSSVWSEHIPLVPPFSFSLQVVNLDGDAVVARVLPLLVAARDQVPGGHPLVEVVQLLGVLNLPVGNATANTFIFWSAT